MPAKSDIEIAQAARLTPIAEVARGMGLSEDDLEPYGRTKAKVHLDVLERLKDRPNGRYVVVTALTPTPLGEGKTTTTVGLGMGLNRIGRRAAIAIRQPSLGPVFGIKGGAAGGGYSQVVPMEDFNLHFTGDMHAIGAAHNLLAAFIDNHLHHGNRLGLDPQAITWNRVLDVSDRALRNVVIGLGGKLDGVPRETHFDITVASEVMSILALTSGVMDLRARLGRIVVGSDRQGSPITADDLGCAGAMTVLLKQALLPNLVQTLENTPAFVHCGPFANIAHGNSSILADRIALKVSDYVVTESGFGADMGCEKFMHIKCRTSGLVPDAAVVVATIRALKMHGGVGTVVVGKPLAEELTKENPGAVEQGCANLMKQIENVRLFGVPPVVCINSFPTDAPSEVAVVQRACDRVGVKAVVSTHWAEGGKGAEALARAVAEAAESGEKRFAFLYDDADTIEEKIRTVATRVYGAGDVDFAPRARKAIGQLTAQGFSELPVCIAKTHLSLSHDPKLMGRPTGFTLPVRDIGVAAGAGFLYALAGDIRTMPGLPSRPAGERVDVDAEGRTVGLF
jgi:formate--tetrahydrofolate ligase